MYYASGKSKQLNHWLILLGSIKLKLVTTSDLFKRYSSFSLAKFLGCLV